MTMNETEMMEVDIDQKAKANETFFFYSSDNYFKGVLVRLKDVGQRRIRLKVYIR